MRLFLARSTRLSVLIYILIASGGINKNDEGVVRIKKKDPAFDDEAKGLGEYIFPLQQVSVMYYVSGSKASDNAYRPLL